MAFDMMTSKKLRIADSDLSLGCAVTLYPGKGAHIEGYGGVLKFTEDEIEFKVKRGKIKLTGESMSFSELTKTDAYIVGRINNVALEVNSEKK